MKGGGNLQFRVKESSCTSKNIAPAGGRIGIKVRQGKLAFKLRAYRVGPPSVLSGYAAQSLAPFVDFSGILGQ